MKKALFLMGLILCLMAACLGAAEGAEDPVLATAYDETISVSLSEVQATYEDALSYYIYMYSMYGQTIDEYDADFQASVAENVVENAIDVKAVMHWAEENGYELTDEKLAEIQAQAEQDVQEIRDYYTDYLAGYGVEGDELESTVEEELAASGYTVEAMVENNKLQDVLDFLRAKASEGITVTEEDARASFDAELEEQKTMYGEDKDSYIDAYLSGVETMYVPEGLRLVKIIYTMLDEETAEDADAETAETEEAASDIADLAGLERANAVLQAIKDGMDFDEAMIAYNEDTSSEEEMLLGYPVYAESTLYSEDFVAAAMALAAAGDVSDEVLVTDYGYFIFKYVSDIEPYEATFEEYKDQEMAEALEEKQSEAYTNLITEILLGADIRLGDLSPLYHVYVGEEMSEYAGYGVVAEQTSLSDKPEGAEIAVLSEGTAVEVLGNIVLENGDAYAFVNVIGTETKGYVKASVLTDVTEAEIVEADNTGKVETVSVSDALPVFTIVMKDGSLIYGELYPEKAPETVANFAELSNQHFYDGLIFHRVIPGFVIQGGDPQGNGTGGPGYTIKGEFTENGVENDLSHVRGVLSMARSSDYDSAGSQFFIMHADGTSLDNQYAAFGMTLGGFDVIDVIASTPTDSNDKPRNDQVIRTIYVETHGETYTFNKIAD